AKLPRSVRTAGLGILQVLEKHFGFGVVRRELQDTLQFRASEIDFLLIEVNLCQHGANESGVARLKRELQFFYRAIEIATPAFDFGKPTMRGSVWRIARQRSAKFRFSGVQAAGGKFLPGTTNARCGSFLNHSTGGRRGAGSSKRVRRG